MSRTADRAALHASVSPVRLALSPGQTHELKLAYELLGEITDAYVAGDKAYDAAPLVQLLESNRCTVVIPSKADRAGQRGIDRHLYKDRHLVECFFRRIKRFRRISMRFEKLARISSRSCTWPPPWCGWLDRWKGI